MSTSSHPEDCVTCALNRAAGAITIHYYRDPAGVVDSPAYAQGFREAVAYWTANPNRIDMPTRKREWLVSQPDQYRAGWAAGAATVD